MRPKRNYLLTIPALAILGCTLAFAQSVPVTDTPTRLLLGHTRLVNSVAFSADGKTIVSGSIDKSVRLWELETGKSIAVLQGHTDQVSSVAFSPDGRFVASASRDKTIKIWDISTLGPPQTLEIDTSERPVVTFSQDGRFIATAGLHGAVSMWEVATLKLVRTFQAPAQVFSLAFSTDGKWLAANRDKVAVIWDVSSGELVRSFEGHDLNILWIAFSPDNRSLATASADETVKLWDISTGKLIQTFRRHQGSVIFVGFLPDGNRLVSAGDFDFSIIFWDATTGKILHVLDAGHGCNCAAFSGDGHWIANCSSSADDRPAVALWKTPLQN